jgi:MFS family permease
MTATTAHGPATDAHATIDRRRAWSFVAAATLASAVALGTVASHGVLVAALVPLTIAGTGAGAVLIAVSSICQFGLGPAVGAMSDRFGIARIVLVGTFAYGTGAAVAATSHDPKLSVVAYAIGTGTAGACTLAPLLAAAVGWHQRRRATAVAIVSAGNGVGALLLAPLLASSVQRQGLQDTWALLGIVGTALLLVSLTVLRAAPRRQVGVERFSLRLLFVEPPLRRFYLAGVVGSAGVIGTLAYLVPYAVELGYRPEHAAGLLGLSGAVGVASRLVVSAVPPSLAFRTYRGSQLGLAASALAWIAAPWRTAYLVVFVVSFGLAAGLWAALAPLVVAHAYPQRLASVLGVLYTSPAIGGALGPVLVGAWSATVQTPQVAWFLAGCLTLAASVLRPLSPTPGRPIRVSPTALPSPACRSGEER